MKFKNADSIIYVASDIWTPVLIWTASVIALADSGNKVLSILLVISGIAWAYKHLYHQTKLKENRNEARRK